VGLIARLTRSPHIHDEVGGLFRRHLAEGRVLDFPAGDGVNSRTLAAAGYTVTPADLFPEGCDAGVPCDRADMRKRLPYADQTFDGVLNSEGIEHIDGQIALLEEFHRVLKPGGILVVTTPNVLNLEGRLGLLLTGHAHTRRAMVASSAAYWAGTAKNRAEGGDVYFGHVFLINLFQLRFYLEHAGFEVLGVDTTRYSWRSLLLAPFLWLPVLLATRKLVRGRRSKVPPDLRRQLLAEALSGAALFGRKLIMVARKP
jgi:SAM-dependent methyltransferase